MPIAGGMVDKFVRFIGIYLQSVASHTPQGLRLGLQPVALADWLNPVAARVQHDCVLKLNSCCVLSVMGKSLNKAC